MQADPRSIRVLRIPPRQTFAEYFLEQVIPSLIERPALEPDFQGEEWAGEEYGTTGHIPYGAGWRAERCTALDTSSRDERRDEQRRQIRQAVSRIVNEDDFRRWLDVRGRFRRYSLYNTLLIAMQRPEATQVAGFKAWRTKFGRQVRAGEKAIRILAPITVKQRDKTTGEVRSVCVGFRGACVFDIEQTEGPSLPRRLTASRRKGTASSTIDRRSKGSLEISATSSTTSSPLPARCATATPWGSASLSTTR